jgi:outer membrane protein assembly factor BamB
VWQTRRSIDFQDVQPDGRIKADGDFRKAFGTPQIVMDGDRPVLVSIGSQATYGYDPMTGQELWRIIERGNFSGSTRPVAGHGLVFYPTGFNTGQIFAIRPDGRGDVAATHVAWKAPRGAPNKPSLLLLDDLLFMVNDGGVLTCLEARTGTEVWHGRLTDSYSASPVSADGRVYFFSEDGKATVIDAGRTFKILAENSLDDGFMASPAIDGRAFYLRTKSHLYRIEAPQP